MRNKKTSFHTMFLRNMVFITIVSIGLCGMVWIYDEYSAFKAESGSLRDEYIAYKKSWLTSEVGNIVRHISYMKDQTEKRLKAGIKNHVYEAHQIAANIYYQNQGAKSLNEIKKMIKDALREVRFNNDRGYYFAVSMDGTEQLYPVKPEFEGKNLINLQDARGHFCIQDEINIIKESDEGFVTDFWPKPDKSPDSAYPKISFVKYFQPLDWYLGTGEYLDDVKEEIQKEVLNYVVGLRFGSDGYFFASTYTGEPLFSNGKITKGGNSIWDLTDTHGVKIIQEQRKAVKNLEGGYVYYVWDKLNSSTPTNKISYVIGIDEWDWIVGAGVCLDTIETTISKNRATLQEGLINKVTKSLMILFALLLLSFLWMKRTSGKIHAGINTFSSFFKKAASQSAEINPADLHFLEFQDLADSANKMQADRIQAEVALKKSEEKYRLLFMHSSDVIYSLDPELKILSVSPSVEKLMGYTPEELIGRTFLELGILASEYFELAFSNTTRILSGESITSTIYEFIAKDGSRKFGELSGAPLYRGNKIIGIIAAARDITDRRLMEQALIENEERYRRIFENIQDVYYETSLDGIIIELSPSVEKFFHYKREALIGKSLYDFYFDPQARDKLVKIIIENGQFNDMEILLKDKDGTIKPCSITSMLISDNQGTPLKIVGSMRDISERKQAAKELQQSEVRLIKAQSVARFGNWEFDIQTGEIWASEEAFAIYGIERTSPMLPLDRVEACVPDAARTNKALVDLIRENKKYDIEFEINREVDGKVILIHSVAERVMENGVPVKVLGILHDITDKRKADKERESLKTQLHQAQKIQALGTLAGGIAHDFNNILFPVVGYTEMLLADTPDDSSRRSFLNEILAGTLRARDLVKQILAVSRQSDQETKPVKVQIILKEVLRLTQSTFPTTIRIKQSVYNNCGMVMADPSRIHQIVMNLITNAFHAMEDTGGILTVSLEEIDFTPENLLDADLPPGPYVCLSVADTGPGMDAAIKEKIFDPYFTTKAVGKGTGLGLSVVHGIVKSYNGSIKVDSECGKGTEFTICLPRIGTEVEADVEIEPEIILTGDERILLIDDEKPITQMLHRMLSDLGYQVTAYNSSSDALEIFRVSPEKFDLIITDLTMPDITGDKLSIEAKKIRPDIPVILCTGFSEKITSDMKAEIGVERILMKPLIKNDLLRAVRNVLDR